MAERPSLEPVFKAIRGADMPPIGWPSRDDRDPLDFTPRVLSNDEKVARYLEACDWLFAGPEERAAAEKWYRKRLEASE